MNWARRLFPGLTLLALTVAPPAQAAQIGDAGAYLRFKHRIWLNNPEGRDFKVRVGIHYWPPYYATTPPTLTPRKRYAGAPSAKLQKQLSKGLNPEIKVRVKKAQCTLHVTAPDGETVLDAKAEGGVVEYTIRGAKGVFELRCDGGPYWVESDLPQMVAQAGVLAAKRGKGGQAEELVYTKLGVPWFSYFPSIYRRYWFFVPRGTKVFTVRVGRIGPESQREDTSVDVFNPRGQRVASFSGDSWPIHMRPQENLPGYKGKVPRRGELVIPVDNMASGRFWSVVAGGADSYRYSDAVLALEGIPPYLADSPEAWFDPATGTRAETVFYDHGWFYPLAKDDKSGREYWTDSLAVNWPGDHGGSGFNGPHRIFFNNPEGRPIEMGLHSDPVGPPRGTLKLVGPGGKVLYEGAMSLQTGWSLETLAPEGTKGVAEILADAPHWYLWLWPAPPVVIAPAQSKAPFRMHASTARYWYFYVPPDTKSFIVSAKTPLKGDAVDLEVHAPDRKMAVIYGPCQKKRSERIQVPPALRGKRWFLRLAPADSSRFVKGRRVRAKECRVDVKLSGVPPLLAPTWEQWFRASLEKE